jgi:hypothetical protein
MHFVQGWHAMCMNAPVASPPQLFAFRCNPEKQRKRTGENN